MMSRHASNTFLFYFSVSFSKQIANKLSCYPISGPLSAHFKYSLMTFNPAMVTSIGQQCSIHFAALSITQP